MDQKSRHRIAGSSAQGHTRQISRYLPDYIFIWNSVLFQIYSGCWLTTIQLLMIEGIMSPFPAAVRSGDHSSLRRHLQSLARWQASFLLTTMAAPLQFIAFQILVCTHTHVYLYKNMIIKFIMKILYDNKNIIFL